MPWRHNSLLCKRAVHGRGRNCDFIIVCISWNNKKCFDTVDARYKHEDTVNKSLRIFSVFVSVAVKNLRHQKEIITYEAVCVNYYYECVCV